VHADKAAIIAATATNTQEYFAAVCFQLMGKPYMTNLGSV
jgi:hypothetical protein